MIQDDHARGEPAPSAVRDQDQAHDLGVAVLAGEQGADTGSVIETAVCPFHCLYQDALSFHTQSRLARSESEASRIARAAVCFTCRARRRRCIRRRSSSDGPSCGERSSIRTGQWRSFRAGGSYRRSPPRPGLWYPRFNPRRSRALSLRASRSETRGPTRRIAKRTIDRRVATVNSNHCKPTRCPKGSDNGRNKPPRLSPHRVTARPLRSPASPSRRGACGILDAAVDPGPPDVRRPDQGSAAPPRASPRGLPAVSARRPVTLSRSCLGETASLDGAFDAAC